MVRPTVLSLPSPAATVVTSTGSKKLYNAHPIFQFHPSRPKIHPTTNKITRLPFLSLCSHSNSSPSLSETAKKISPPPLKTTKRRHRKQYPGEQKGISEELRFVAMRLRNSSQKTRDATSITTGNERDYNSESENDGSEAERSDRESENDRGGAESISGLSATWEPNVEGFVKYLVDSKLVFDTVESIVDESSDVSYVYFRNTGLERSKSVSKDLEWFSQQDVLIPEPSKPGITYVEYLKELAEKSPPLFLCHFYNIYFAHIAGGQVVTKEVSKRLFEGRALKFSSWPGNEEELLRGMREKLNLLGEHWSRNEKTKCLAEAKKAFRYLGQIVRLIVL